MATVILTYDETLSSITAAASAFTVTTDLVSNNAVNSHHLWFYRSALTHKNCQKRPIDHRNLQRSNAHI